MLSRAILRRTTAAESSNACVGGHRHEMLVPYAAWLGLWHFYCASRRRIGQELLETSDLSVRRPYSELAACRSACGELRGQSAPSAASGFFGRSTRAGYSKAHLSYFRQFFRHVTLKQRLKK